MTPICRPLDPRGIAALARCAGAAGGCLADSVFVSVGPDGSHRYASQRLDASYTPLRAGIADGAPVWRAVTVRDGPYLADVARAVAAVESGGNPQAVSVRGARGLMQLMPATAARYGITDARLLHRPAIGMEVGVKHLRALLAANGGNLAMALAAYNAGEGAIHRAGDRIPPYRETMLYVPAVLARLPMEGAHR